jgi:DNA-binding LacI/PurR family transcriptional regulator
MKTVHKAGRRSSKGRKPSPDHPLTIEVDPPQKRQRVDLALIAKKVGVSRMTVSRALRGISGCAAGTRKKIMAVAQRLGYRPNPFISMYQSSLRTSGLKQLVGLIGWLNDHPSPDAWSNPAWPWMKKLYDGAAQRADELGYGMKSLWLEDIDRDTPERNVTRYQQKLHSLAIHGVILPQLYSARHAAFEWSTVSVVSLGSHSANIYTPKGASEPIQKDIYHCVRADYFANVVLACSQLRAAGFRRIGFHLSRWKDKIDGMRSRCAFLGMQQAWPEEERIPILFDGSVAQEVPSFFREWLDRWKPEVVLCSQNNIVGWIEQTGRRVPEDISVAHLGLAEDVADWAGVDILLERLGGIAVDVLVAQMHRNDRGIPQARRDIITAGVWRDGRTLLNPGLVKG